MTTAFYKGKPCKKCGSTKRYQSNASCVGCTRRRNIDRGKAETAARRQARSCTAPPVMAVAYPPPQKTEEELQADCHARNKFLQTRWGQTA